MIEKIGIVEEKIVKKGIRIAVTATETATVNVTETGIVSAEIVSVIGIRIKKRKKTGIVNVATGIKIAKKIGNANVTKRNDAVKIKNEVVNEIEALLKKKRAMKETQPKNNVQNQEDLTSNSMSYLLRKGILGQCFVCNYLNVSVQKILKSSFHLLAK